MSVRRVAVGLLVLGLLAGATTACSASPSASPPEYAARDRTGRPVSMTELRGAPALLTSWATWCKECKTLLPELERLHEAQGPRGVRVVAVNIDAPGREDAVVALEHEYGMRMERWRDTDNDFASAFRSRGVPTSVLVDAHGAVVRRWPGGVPTDDPEVRRLLVRAVRDARA